MSDAAATLTQDRQRLELSALSAPAVIFTVAMIAFPVVYTIWLGFQSFSSTGQQSFAGLANYAKLGSRSPEGHAGLWGRGTFYRVFSTVNGSRTAGPERSARGMRV